MLSFKQSPESFFVDEELFYDPQGQGSHLFYRIRKWSMSTRALKRKISEQIGVPLAHIHHAGQKDQLATATQWLSWPEAAQKSPLKSGDGFEVIESHRHEHALSIGHVKRNHFKLLLTAEEPQRAAAFLTERQGSFPNLFGPQRFGQSLKQVDTDHFVDLLRGPRSKNPNTISVIQSWFFNLWLLRHLEGYGRSVAEDELWMRVGGKQFFESDPDEEILRRFEIGEISPSGPLFGYKVKLRASEQAFLAEMGLEAEAFRRWGKAAKGTRRPLFVRPSEYSATPTEQGVTLAFGLPSGSYATMLLTHLVAPEPLKQGLACWPDYSERVRFLLPEPRLDHSEEAS